MQMLSVLFNVLSCFSPEFLFCFYIRRIGKNKIKIQENTIIKFIIPVFCPDNYFVYGIWSKKSH